MKREPITFTQAMMADLEIRQGARRGEVASRLLPDTSPQQAAALLRTALKAHGLYQHNPGRQVRK
jgi:hypothetical protein